MVALSSCGSDGDAPTIRGTVSFAEAVTLESTWRLLVQLEDVSVEDGPRTIVTSYSNNELNELPLRYSMTYVQTEIDSRNRYNVSASIYDDTDPTAPALIYTTVQSYPVLTQGFGNEADVVLSRVE
jgi:uncharacterized lipoprotein YbaY